MEICMGKWLFTDKDGKPVMPVGLQAHNSSTGSALIQKSLRALELFGGNTLEAPVYWNQIEKTEGTYDCTLVRDLIDEVRNAGKYLVILWFGMSKNGHPNYAPEYVKLHPEIYHIAQGHDLAPVASLSPHCRATRDRDCAAFAEMMRFLKEYDQEEKTVLAVQIENEMGYANTDRDYSEKAEADYRKEVPEELEGCTVPGAFDDSAGKTSEEVGQEECRSESLTDAGNRNGSRSENQQISVWKKRFGRYSHEAFSAWYTARYIETLAKAGKEIYPLPLYTNVMVGESGFEEAGLCYNAGAGVARVLDIWKKAAPDLDVIAPDIYNPARRDYCRICDSYARPDNPLFVPESPIRGQANAMNMILAAGEYGAEGIACFGAEEALNENGELNPESEDTALSMRILAKAAPLLIHYRGTGRIHAFAQEEFEEYRYLKLPEYHVTIWYTNCHAQRYGYSTDTFSETGRKKVMTRGRAILVQTAPEEFYLCGAGAMAEFVRRPSPESENSYAQMASRQSSQLNFLSVEEGHFEEDHWVCDFIRNGDETNFAQYVLDGQMIRIRLNPKVE